MTLHGMPHAAPGNSRQRPGAFWVAAGVLFAVTPWATLGFGTPLAFAGAAAAFSYLRRAGTAVLWISAGVYAAALTARGVLVGSRSPDSAIADTCMLILLVVAGGLQALFTLRAAARDAARPVPGQRAGRARLHDMGRIPKLEEAMPVVAVLAIAVLVCAVPYLRWADSLMARHRTTAGTVIAVREDVQTCYPNSCGAIITYRLTIRYRPAGSRPVTFTQGGNPRPVAVTTRVPVYYVSGTSYASIDSPAQDRETAIFWIAASWLLYFLLGLSMIIARAARGNGHGASAHGRGQNR